MANQVNQVDQLKKLGTVIVADTGDLQAITKYKPTDATTNPSLVLKALNQLKPGDEKKKKEKEKEKKKNGDGGGDDDDDDEKKNEKYLDIIQLALKYAKENSKDDATTEEILSLAIDRLSCEFGFKILQIIEGYVSTELDARLSFDTDACVERALQIMKIYESIGIKNPKDRVLIKIASTWEGIQAAKILKQKHGIKTNMTLLFSIWQAAAAAHIGDAFLISPFVGRITDWHKKAKNVENFKASEDPGVLSVQEIYHYYKKNKVETIVMGASFRNKEQILEIAGIDRCTISPEILEKLQSSNDIIEKKLPNNKLIAENEKNEKNEKKKSLNNKINVNEKTFRWGMNEDACATEKLAEGIRKFAEDTIAVEEILKKYITY